MRMTSRWLARLCALALVPPLLLAGCATTSSRGDALRRVQYAYSAAIRWGDFEGAWQLVDPAYREQHPLSDLEFARYRQIQISAYRELAADVGDDIALREIQVGVVNRHTQVERTLRYTERWRYDPEAGSWWLTVGLPDLWQGE